MILNNAVIGKTYRGTADGPEKLDGVFFTPLTMVTFHPEGRLVTDPLFREESLVQVQYDAWGYPLPESIVFAPGDWIVPIDEVKEKWFA